MFEATPIPPPEADVVVVGGGPAGLAVGIALAMRGHQTVVADHAELPLDKCCGEGLLPEALQALRALGVQTSAESSWPFHGICFKHGSRRAQAEFPDQSGRGMRRTVLHQALVERAQQAGVLLFWGKPVTVVDNNTVSLGDDTIRTKWIVGCDGMQSQVRQWAGLEAGIVSAPRYGFRRHAQIRPWSQFVEVYWGPNLQIYVTPTAANQVGIAVLSQDPQLRVADGLQQFPELEAQLGSAEWATSERGALTMNRKLVDLHRGNVVLAGDASGSVDAITGLGLGVGFQQALALADAITNQDLDAYTAAHRRIMRHPNRMADALLLMGRSSWLASRTVSVLERQPELFRALLAMHVGRLDQMEELVTHLRLGWNILTG